jgi:hypothetical protein
MQGTMRSPSSASRAPLSTGALFLLLIGCQADVQGDPLPPGTAAQAGSGVSGGAGGTMSGAGGMGASGGSQAAGAGGSNPSGGSPAGGSAGTPGAGTGNGGSDDCSAPQAAATPLRVLTESQYKNTVLDIFRIASAPEDLLAQGLDDVALERRANAAAAVATQAAANLAPWAPCTDTSESCKLQIIDVIGARAYRHPLVDSERAELKALFDAGVTEKDYATGVEWFVTGLLQSPDFIYQVVRPVAGETPGEVRPLGGHEYASRLAYFIWDGAPDDALSAAAANGDLSDPVKRDAEVARMLADPRFSRGVAQFYTRWLGMVGFDELARDADGFDQDLVASLATSLLMSATELYKAPNPNITSLFSGDTYYLNDVLRNFYGVSGTGSAFTAAPMTGESRRGILTHPAMMAKLARPGESFPIGRGLFLLRNVLCQVILAPDGIEIPPLPPLVEGTSTRERLEAHTSSPTCQGCHALINPSGFAFESFDEVGQFRTVDHGKPVDSSGRLELGLPDIDGSFATGDELLAKLGQSQSVRACFAEKYQEFALARTTLEPADACSLRALRESFGPSGDLVELVVSVAGSDSFRLRRAEGVGQ